MTNEPIPVSLALRAVERAIKECDAATPGPWEAMGRFIDGAASDVLTSDVRCYQYCQGGSAEGMSEADVAFAVLARSGFRGTLEHLASWLSLADRDSDCLHAEARAVAPLIAHYDRTAPGWRTE